MKLYQITKKGQLLARSVSNPDTPTTRVLVYMDNNGSASNEQIKSRAGVEEQEASTAIGKLKRLGAIREV